jgi:zinc transport system ATP-binding protein
MTALISCEGLSMGYGANMAFEDLNFHVNTGDYLCVVGANGSGKSTLLKGLLRLLKPFEGSITYGDGLALEDIGYVAQQSPASPDFPASAYEVVISGSLGKRRVLPFYTKRDKIAALENMGKIGVSDLKNRSFGELSGGQQRRVLLARALCSAERLLILDEPVSGLDPDAAGDFYDIAENFNRNDGMTIVMVSHDVGRAVAGASRVLHIDGRQRFFGTRDEYLKSDLGRKFAGIGGAY